ncbi:sensor histidine kinase [Microbacterium pullorum]|uniref:sensor histidine kinase n=1 Tax=Microbacterium pullorum TaxID=2762236 RepID=UPI00296B2B6F|nr:GAF domain-containing protein [Microbacterium pullorum]
MEQIELSEVLRRAVLAATELVDAEYGALGVLAPERDGLERFITVGMTSEEAAAVGHLSACDEVLHALIADPSPVRLTDVSRHAYVSGDSPPLPARTSALAVPIRIRGEVFGTFYLTSSRDDAFTDEDEQLLSALAATSGFAIDNARLFADTEARRRWATAAADLVPALASMPLTTSFDLIATRVFHVADATSVAVLLLGGDGENLRVAAFRGAGEATRLGAVVSPTSPVFDGRLDDASPHAFGRRVAEDTDGLLVDDGGFVGPSAVIPLRHETRLWGLLTLARRPDQPRFSAAEMEGAGDLASQASYALELARAREDGQRALLADDRRRIARDLHDHVIQQLFGAGLGLQSVSGRLGPGAETNTIHDAIDQIDEAITQIRTVVFALSQRDETSLRHQLLDVLGELSAETRRPPAIRFTGPVDHLVRGDLGTDVVAAARELLSNAIKHADATHISIEVAVAEGVVSVVVADDGAGMGSGGHRRGLVNLEERALGHGGAFDVQSSRSGTTATWTARTTSPAAGGHGDRG